LNNTIRGDLWETVDAFYSRNGNDKNVKAAAQETIAELETLRLRAYGRPSIIQEIDDAIREVREYACLDEPAFPLTWKRGPFKILLDKRGQCYRVAFWVFTFRLYIARFEYGTMISG